MPVAVDVAPMTGEFTVKIVFVEIMLTDVIIYVVL